MTSSLITGWDIGGAHVKVAQCTSTGQLIDVFELSCPLWLGLEHLSNAINTARQQLAPSTRHAITMTGELVDLFPNRQAGVAAILTHFNQHIPAEQCQVYAGQTQWLSPNNAQQSWPQVASQNWQASATYAAQKISDGLFVDVGSTTSDIIAISQHQSQAVAFNDFERQIAHELYYAGAIRTPLIAIAHQAQFQQNTVPLAAEFFATTADCWILTNALQAESINDQSADGKSWQKHHCVQRIARLLGTDADAHPMTEWIQLARWFNQQQTLRLSQACQHVIQQHPELPDSAPLIGAGVGRFMVKLCAEQLARPYLEFDALLDNSHQHAADHAPAVAVALLACNDIT